MSNLKWRLAKDGFLTTVRFTRDSLRKKRRVRKFGFLPWIIIGILILFSTMFNIVGELTETPVVGKVTKVGNVYWSDEASEEKTYAQYVDYTYNLDGKTYEINNAVYYFQEIKGDKEVGDSITIYTSALRPELALPHGSYLDINASLKFCLLSALFIVIGILKKRRYIKQLNEPEPVSIPTPEEIHMKLDEMFEDDRLRVAAEMAKNKKDNYKIINSKEE